MKYSLLSQSINFGGQTLEGPLKGANGEPINNVGQLISRILVFMLPLAGVILLIVFIWGGYDFMMSQGNPEKLKSAQAKITTGIIGFILLVLSYLIVRLLSSIFGLQGGLI